MVNTASDRAHDAIEELQSIVEIFRDKNYELMTQISDERRETIDNLNKINQMLGSSPNEAQIIDTMNVIHDFVYDIEQRENV